MKTTPDNEKLLNLIDDARIVNRTLISGRTNGRIHRKSPSKYLTEIVPAARERKIMASHFVDDDGLAAMQSDGFDAFLDARELSLLTEVISRVGDRAEGACV